VIAIAASTAAVMSVGVARAANPDVAGAAISLPHGVAAIDEVDVKGAVWTLAIDLERGYVDRIDSATHRITTEIELPTGTPTGDNSYYGGMVAAAGSLWVTEAFRDEVLRINPETGRIVARIPTGRYPAFLAAGGGSIWVAQDEAGSVARIAPGSNAVVATVAVGRQDGSGRDQPFELTWDTNAGRLLVTLPFSHRVASISGAGQRLGYFAVSPASACGRAIPVPGGFWLDDTPCSNDMFRWDDAARGITAHFAVVAPFNSSFGGVALGSVLYTGEQICAASGCRDGTVAKRDARTGAVLATRHTGTSLAYLPALAGGDLWVADFDHALLARVALF
jgi:DNA-binding beta-propeller fold protein YncE